MTPTAKNIATTLAKATIKTTKTILTKAWNATEEYTKTPTKQCRACGAPIKPQYTICYKCHNRRKNMP